MKDFLCQNWPIYLQADYEESVVRKIRFMFKVSGHGFGPDFRVFDRCQSTFRCPAVDRKFSNRRTKFLRSGSLPKRARMQTGVKPLQLV